MLDLADFGSAVWETYQELAPHRLCAYIYKTANDFNRFYHDTKILSEEDDEKRVSYLALLQAVRKALEKSIELLGFTAPEHM